MGDTEKRATDAPEQIEVRGIDILPYQYGIWCTVQGHPNPFVNVVELRKWSEDGDHIWLMLGTHNFYKCRPDELVRVVKCNPVHDAGKCSKSLFGCDCAKCFPDNRPKILPAERDLIDQVRALPKESRERVLKAARA